jgi:hypothetical protein
MSVGACVGTSSHEVKSLTACIMESQNQIRPSFETLAGCDIRSSWMKAALSKKEDRPWFCFETRTTSQKQRSGMQEGGTDLQGAYAALEGLEMI